MLVNGRVVVLTLGVAGLAGSPGWGHAPAKPGGPPAGPVSAERLLAGLPLARSLAAPGALPVVMVCKKNAAGKWVWHNCQVVGGSQQCTPTTAACTP
jgi:hypothetical protein